MGTLTVLLVTSHLLTSLSVDSYIKGNYAEGDFLPHLLLLISISFAVPFHFNISKGECLYSAPLLNRGAFLLGGGDQTVDLSPQILECLCKTQCLQTAPADPNQLPLIKDM